MAVANWNYPTPIRFGAGRIAELPAICVEFGLKRPLLVTDHGLASHDMITSALSGCLEAGLSVALFSGVQSNPTGSQVAAGLEAYRSGGHDGVIAFGGGSAMDAGKAIALMQGQRRPLWDFEDVGDWWTRADPAGIAPVVAVPTTAGTGSEVGRASVITDEERTVKKIIFHPKMLPVVVISDPTLTVGLPPDLTAWTGMDALAHCLEAYCAPSFHPIAEGIAVEGMRLIKDALPRAVRDGSDLEARGRMLVAASMGAAAFQKGLGAIHALSHPVGAVHNTHHGLTNAVFMPYVLEFNRFALGEKADRLTRWLGLAPGVDGLLGWVLEFRRELGIPHTLREIGLDGSSADRIAAMAPEDPSAGGNPVALTVDGSRAVFVAALEGKL